MIIIEEHATEKSAKARRRELIKDGYMCSIEPVKYHEPDANGTPVVITLWHLRAVKAWE